MRGSSPGAPRGQSGRRLMRSGRRARPGGRCCRSQARLRCADGALSVETGTWSADYACGGQRGLAEVGTVGRRSCASWSASYAWPVAPHGRPLMRRLTCSDDCGPVAGARSASYAWPRYGSWSAGSGIPAVPAGGRHGVDHSNRCRSQGGAASPGPAPEAIVVAEAYLRCRRVGPVCVDRGASEAGSEVLGRPVMRGQCPRHAGRSAMYAGTGRRSVFYAWTTHRVSPGPRLASRVVRCFHHVGDLVDH